MRALLIIATAVLGLASCGGGAFDPPISDDLINPLRVLDLNDRAVYRAPEGFEPTATRLVFRRIPRVSRNIDSADAVNEVGPTTPATTTAAITSELWLCTHELSQAQWNALAPTLSNPWLSVTPNSAGGGAVAVSDNKPAWGLDADSCVDVFADWSAANPNAILRLPTASEWELAARSPSGAGEYGWGDNPNDANDYANLLQTAGPRTITGHTSLGGFYDLHGNMWEWVSNGATFHLRGGSWCDTAVSAASGNRRDCPSDLNYALAGVRPVLVLP